MKSLFEQTRFLLNYVTGVIYFFKIENYNYAYQFAQGTTNLLQDYLVNLPEQNAQDFLPVLNMALDAMEEQDGTRLADIYEEGLLPLLYQMQQELFETSDDILVDCWGKNRRILKERFPELYRNILECRENIPDKYQLSWAKTGDLVLDVVTNQGLVRMNSMSNPWQEALFFTEHVAGEKEYLVIGFGLGYHLELLMSQASCKKIVVLENDINQLAIALSYRDLSVVLESKKVTLIYSPDVTDYSKNFRELQENTKVCFWYPSIKSISDCSLREMLENYKVEFSSIENMGSELRDNFIANIEKKDKEVSVLMDNFKNKSVLLVGAGPSLDANIELLKKRDVSKTILVCVGKVAAKLIIAGVKLDYIVMTDGLSATRWQINGIEEYGVPLIYLSTVASSVVEDYKGKRYIAFQYGFPEAKKYAKEHGYHSFQTGGSVATFILDMLIEFKCSKIICVGLDMGYPGERTHTAGLGKTIVDRKNLRKVEGVNSEYVYTNKPMDIYRLWIEKRIKGVKDIEFINASKGARIHGMKEDELSRYL